MLIMFLTCAYNKSEMVGRSFMEDKKVDLQQMDNLFNHNVFKVLSQPIRIEILKVLAVNGPSDIQTISSNFCKHRSVISKHLKMMYEAGIIIKTKESRNTIYQVDGMGFLHQLEDVVGNLKTVLAYNCEDIFDTLYQEKKTYKEYLDSVNSIKNNT